MKAAVVRKPKGRLELDEREPPKPERFITGRNAGRSHERAGRTGPRMSFKSTTVRIPRLYALLDTSLFADPNDIFAFAAELAAAGVTLLQYRDKSGNAPQMLEPARELKRRLADSVRVIMNDRADLCLAAGFDGVHVGQDDLSPEGARGVIGDALWLGVSTHNPAQVTLADQTSADYIAVGPVFPTASKASRDPVIGLEGVRTARALTRKPLIAIGGISRANCRSVIEAGADAVAVISDLLRAPRKSAEEFLRILG